MITPLQDVITFYPPKIPIGSGTSLSSGLNALMNAIDKDITKTTYEVKGDWKPIVFLFTDGIPTDNTNSEISRWNSNYRNKTNLVIISIGDNTNYNLLGKLSDNVLQFNHTDTNSYKAFFKWVTASIKATSENINNTNSDGINLSKVDAEIVEKIDLSKKHTVPDENFVVLNGKCSQTNKLYLIKFESALERSGIADFQTRIFKVQGAYKIDEHAYKEFSADRDYSLKISSDELYGNPSCPCCSNRFSLAHCSCGGIHCISGDDLATCPWCGNTAYYGTGKGNFDINRTLG